MSKAAKSEQALAKRVEVWELFDVFSLLCGWGPREAPRAPVRASPGRSRKRVPRANREGRT